MLTNMYGEFVCVSICAYVMCIHLCICTIWYVLCVCSGHNAAGVFNAIVK